MLCASSSHRGPLSLSLCETGCCGCVNCTNLSEGRGAQWMGHSAAMRRTPLHTSGPPALHLPLQWHRDLCRVYLHPGRGRSPPAQGQWDSSIGCSSEGRDLLALCLWALFVSWHPLHSHSPLFLPLFIYPFSSLIKFQEEWSTCTFYFCRGHQSHRMFTYAH